MWNWFYSICSGREGHHKACGKQSPEPRFTPARSEVAMVVFFLAETEFWLREQPLSYLKLAEDMNGRGHFGLKATLFLIHSRGILPAWPLQVNSGFIWFYFWFRVIKAFCPSEEQTFFLRSYSSELLGICSNHGLLLVTIWPFTAYTTATFPWKSWKFQCYL